MSSLASLMRMAISGLRSADSVRQVIRVTSPIRGLVSDELYYAVVPGQEKKPSDKVV